MGWLRPWFESMFYEEMGDLWMEMERISSHLDPSRRVVHCKQTPEEVVVRVEIPELNPRHEIDVRVEENNMLYISGITGRDEADNRTQFRFTLNVYLPAPVNPSEMMTDIDQETKRLTLRLPKKKRLETCD